MLSPVLDLAAHILRCSPHLALPLLDLPYLFSILWVCMRVAKSLQLCPTLCNPMDYSLPESSVHGIFQARILEWVAISSPRGSSQPGDQTRVSYFLHWQAGSLSLASPGKPPLLPEYLPKVSHSSAAALRGPWWTTWWQLDLHHSAGQHHSVPT